MDHLRSRREPSLSPDTTPPTPTPSASRFPACPTEPMLAQDELDHQAQLCRHVLPLRQSMVTFAPHHLGHFPRAPVSSRAPSPRCRSSDHTTPASPPRAFADASPERVELARPSPEKLRWGGSGSDVCSSILKAPRTLGGVEALVERRMAEVGERGESSCRRFRRTLRFSGTRASAAGSTSAVGAHVRSARKASGHAQP